MKAVHKFLIGGAAVAAAAGGFAAPAAAQYYPGGGHGGGNVLVGAILDSILRGSAGGYGGGYGGQYGGYGNYGYANERVAVDQCARATEARLNGRYGGGYGGYGGYGYNAGIRVNQIERVERTRNGNFRVVGWAGDAGWRGNYGGYGGYNAPYGGGYNNAAAPSYRFSCKFEVRSGRISDLDLDRQRYARYGYGY